LAADARTNHHRGLARALQATGRAEPELLASHLDGAGERSEAARHWQRAADQAFSALALDRAARLYRQSIAAHTAADPDPAMLRGLRVRLGETLGHAGRGAEAAATYIEASTDAEPTTAIDLRRRALEHYLWSGHVDEGFGVLGSVLVATGLTMPRTGLGVGVRILGHMLLRRLRGLRRRPNPAGDTPLELARLDVATAAGASLGMLDPPRAIYFHLCSLELALRSSDSYRLLLVLATELGLRGAIRGSRPPGRADNEVEQLIQRVYAELPPTDPRLLAIDGGLALVIGVRHLFRGEVAAACAELERAEARLMESPVKVGNLLGMTRVWFGLALHIGGAWRRLAELVTRGLADARQRGDRFGRLQLQQWDHWFELVADRPDAAVTAIDRWHTDAQRFDRSRDLGGIADYPMVLLYRDGGIGDAAWRRFEADRRVGMAIMWQLNPMAGAWSQFVRGGAYLAVAAAYDEQRPLRIVERVARTLSRLRTPYGAPLSTALQAGVAAHRGDRARAVGLLVEAEADFARLGAGMHVAAVKRRRGELMGGEAGQRLIASVDEALAAEGVQNPARMVAMTLPGRW
jgi:hypothetical protein